jgi:hypothetical protein
MAWFIEAWNVLDGLAFAAERADEHSEIQQMRFLAAPHFAPEFVAHPGTMSAATRRLFQDGFYDEDQAAIAFDSIEQVRECVRRGYIAGSGRTMDPTPAGGAPPRPEGGGGDLAPIGIDHVTMLVHGLPYHEGVRHGVTNAIRASLEDAALRSYVVALFYGLSAEVALPYTPAFAARCFLVGMLAELNGLADVPDSLGLPMLRYDWASTPFVRPADIFGLRFRPNTLREFPWVETLGDVLAVLLSDHDAARDANSARLYAFSLVAAEAVALSAVPAGLWRDGWQGFVLDQAARWLASALPGCGLPKTCERALHQLNTEGPLRLRERQPEPAGVGYA